MARFQVYTKRWISGEKIPEKKMRTKNILQILKATYPNAAIALKYSSPFQLLVTVILSAQCTDKKVNEVTEILFQKYKTAHDFASLKQKALERAIKPTGFYRNKAKNIIESAKIIENKYKGNLPKSMADMLTLKGVARKTANVVLGNAYNIVEGIAVDTHVSRISQRLGLTTHDDPVKIERDLMNLIPLKDWFKFTYIIIEHGRAVCVSQKPKCRACPLRNLCPSSLE